MKRLGRIGLLLCGVVQSVLTVQAEEPELRFGVHGDRDVYSAMGSVKCWEQLRRMGIPGDLHTLAGRGHTFQAKAAPETGSWT